MSDFAKTKDNEKSFLENLYSVFFNIEVKHGYLKALEKAIQNKSDFYYKHTNFIGLTRNVYRTVIISDLIGLLGNIDRSYFTFTLLFLIQQLSDICKEIYDDSNEKIMLLNSIKTEIAAFTKGDEIFSKLRTLRNKNIAHKELVPQSILSIQNEVTLEHVDFLFDRTKCFVKRILSIFNFEYLSPSFLDIEFLYSDTEEDQN